MPPEIDIPAEVRKRVKKGAKLLDDRYTGWWREPFDWDAFNINSLVHCILGQLNQKGRLGTRVDVGWAGYQNSPYYKGLYALELTSFEETTYGFAGAGHSNGVFKAAWKREVDKRLAHDPEPSEPARRQTVPEPLFTDDENDLIVTLLKEHRAKAATLRTTPVNRRLAAVLDGEILTVDSLLAKLA